MARAGAIVAAMKAVPGGARYTPAPQSSGMGGISPVMSELYFNNPYAAAYGPFLPRPSSVFTDGGFSPASPIQPTPIDVPPPGGLYAEPRRWQPRPSWNLPTPPGSEGLKLASFAQLKTLSEKYCLSDQTRVLCADFTWRKLAEIGIGDELIAFDENSPAPGKHRKMRTAVVTDHDRIIRPSYKITFADGRQVTASAEHLWLAGRDRLKGADAARECGICGKGFRRAQGLGAHLRRSHDVAGSWKERDFGSWIPTSLLRPGAVIRDLGQPWDQDASWESGYLAGVFDGEASFAMAHGKINSWTISFPQKPGAVFDLTDRLLKEKGFRTRYVRAGKSGCRHLVISGIHDCFRFLGEVRPQRLLEKAPRWLDGGSPARSSSAVVESVEFLGEQEVIAVGTSTKTLIAEGLFSHNSVARQCIQLRIDEILALDWQITLTTDAAKAYQGSPAMLRDFGERQAKVRRFFNHPDPNYWSFRDFLCAMLQEIFTYDALSVIFRPKYGEKFGMTGRGLLGSSLDSLQLISGPTIRPLLDLHGATPRPPAPAYQQFLFGVPRSDVMSILRETDLDEGGLRGAEVNSFDAATMLYAPMVRRVDTPYGFPPVERALLPIISGLQKQEFQLDYFAEGTVPAVYISPGDTNINPTQIGELQNALNALAGDPAYHLKVVVLPPGSRVEPQRPVDLSDSFDYLVQTQVAMAFDVNPVELGIIPNVGATPQGPSASGIRFAGQEKRDIKSRVSAKPLLRFLCDIFNYVIQDICAQPDMQFQFEGLVDDEDKAAITSLGVEQIQNGIAAIDEVRERLDLPPWGMAETSEPIVITQNGPITFSQAPKLIEAMLSQGQDGGSSTSGKKKSPVKPRKGTGATSPDGSHPAPVSPSRPDPANTPAHAAAQASLRTLRPQRGRTGGTAGRSQTPGSRKRGEGLAPTQGRLRNKAVQSELAALKRHLGKGRLISTWEPVHITGEDLARISWELEKGASADAAIGKLMQDSDENLSFAEEEPRDMYVSGDSGDTSDAELEYAEEADKEPMQKAAQFPGWEHDLGLAGEAQQKLTRAFAEAEEKGSDLRRKAATGQMWVSAGTLHGLISDAMRGTFLDALTPVWEKAWDLGYDGGLQLARKAAMEPGASPPLSLLPSPEQRAEVRQAFLATEGQHWTDQVSRTGLKDPQTRAAMIARTEVARAVNAGVLQAYKDCGVTFKHLLVAPDDRKCKVCKTASAQGVIPLDGIYQGGNPPFHPRCRCVSAPAGENAVPPFAHLRKAAMAHPYKPSPFSGAGNCWCGHAEGEHEKNPQEDESRLCWILLRSVDEDGKYRFLLQQRSDGSWGMPGGKPYIGEDPWNAAYRETEEELGELPPLEEAGTFHHVENDGETRVYLYLCDTDYFQPRMNGSTPEETQGAAWFRRKEIGKLDLTPKFREDWESGITLKDNVTKNLQNTVTPEGEWLVLDDPDRHGAGMGARWVYPHRGDGEEVPGMHWPDAGPGYAPAAEPPHQGPQEMSSQPQTRIYPRGSEDEEFPRRRSRNKPPSRFPDQGSQQEGKVPGGGTEPFLNDATGVPSARKGASDYNDANPVDAEHIYIQLARNFPPEAIAWVKRARWTGPVWVPWDRVDTDDKDKWAASHQPGKVNEFARQMKEHDGHVAPSILVQEPSTNKAFIVDGHHRALAREKLGQKVLAYVGNIDPKDRLAAWETHTKQLHAGSDPANKGTEPPKG